MRQPGSRTILALFCLLLTTHVANAQSSLININKAQSVIEDDSVLFGEEARVSSVTDGTIFDSKTLSFGGDVSEDGGSLNVTYRFGKFFMGFAGQFSGSSTSQNSSLSANGVNGSGRLRYQDTTTMSYRIGRFVAPGVAVYGMLGTSMAQIDGSVSAGGSSTVSSTVTIVTYDAVKTYEKCNWVTTLVPITTTETISANHSYSGSSATNNWSGGMMLGGGMEMLLAGRVHLRAEYRYIDFGTLTQTVNFTNTTTNNLLPNEGPASAQFNFENNFHSARLAVFYRF